MQFDLHAIVKRHDNFEVLCSPFSTEEIDTIILDLPSDKAPGPDGFNNTFIKKCWPIIRGDMHKLCFDFFHHRADLKSINHSCITLVPKKDNPEKVNDFRPSHSLTSLLRWSPSCLLTDFNLWQWILLMKTSMVLLKGEQFKTGLGFRNLTSVPSLKKGNHHSQAIL
jgi:hypothetical protein